jgi:hypothetical protein
MRTKLLAVVPATLVVLVLGACNDSTTPLTDQAQVLAAAQSQLGAMLDTSFGQSGSMPSLSVVGGVMSVDSVAVPQYWGRIRLLPGGPRPVIHRDVTIQGDTARVTQTVSYQGLFVQDTAPDTTFAPVAKPLSEGHTQSAIFVRDQARVHGWRAVALTIQNWQTTNVSRRTVAVDSLSVYVNDTLKLTVRSPDSLFDVVNRIPRLHVGDTVKVVAGISNATAAGFTPATFAFLHVRHIDPVNVSWHRLKMQDNGNGTWQRTFIVRHTGIDRFVVDAIDGGVFGAPAADNYRASEWGIPYRIE